MRLGRFRWHDATWAREDADQRSRPEEVSQHGAYAKPYSRLAAATM
jgi:hypothetical protein